MVHKIGTICKDSVSYSLLKDHLKCPLVVSETDL